MQAGEFESGGCPLWGGQLTYVIRYLVHVTHEAQNMVASRWVRIMRFRHMRTIAILVLAIAASILAGGLTPGVNADEPIRSQALDIAYASSQVTFLWHLPKHTYLF